MEEEKKQKKPLDLAFWIGLIAALAAFAFTFAPMFVYETKVVVGDTKIKTKYNVGLVDLLSGKITNPWPVYVMLGLFVLGLGLFLAAKFSQKKKDALYVGSIFSYLLSVIAMFFEREYFNLYAPDLIANYNGVEMGWASSVYFILLCVAIICELSSTNYAQQSDVRGMAEDGILVAAAFVLNFIKIPLGQAGSINLQMLPLMVIALRRGPVHGLVAGGVVYGLLTCITDGYGLQTYPFDYFIGFGSVFFMGFFQKWIFPANHKGYSWKAILTIFLTGVVSTFIRFCGSCASSMIFYNYTLVAAMAYNAIYIPVSGVAAIVILCALQGPLSALNKRYPAKKIVSEN